jgi:hypothetical protein
MRYMKIKESERELSLHAQKNLSLHLPLRFLNEMRTMPIESIDHLAPKLGVSRDKLVEWATLYEIGGAILLLDHRVHSNPYFVDQVLRQNRQKVSNPGSVSSQLQNNRPNHWSQLPPEMQSLLLSKIKPDKPGKSVPERFNEMIQGALTATTDNQKIKDRMTTVKNFIAASGGHKNSELWNQIKEITFIDVNQLAVQIVGRDAFIAAAKREGFEKILLEDKIAHAIGKGYHGNDSLRQISDISSQPSMHFANDKGGDIYFVHWDPTSTSIRHGSIKTGNMLNDFLLKQVERATAGKAHGKEQLSPDRVRADLRSRGLIPEKVE